MNKAGCLLCERDYKMIPSLLPLLREKNVDLIRIPTDESHERWVNYLDNHGYRSRTTGWILRTTQQHIWASAHTQPNSCSTGKEREGKGREGDISYIANSLEEIVARIR